MTALLIWAVVLSVCSTTMSMASIVLAVLTERRYRRNERARAEAEAAAIAKCAELRDHAS